MKAVVAEGLTKHFGKTEALRGVDFDVERGTVLALLGPNGAGKTTAVRILATLIKPDAGRARIDGIDVVEHPRRVRTRIGLTGQYAAVDERLTGFENLQHVGRLFHLRLPAARRRASELLERFDLVDAGGRVVKGYSGGMRRRLDIAMSLIGNPSVLFLDEPTTGLDPRSRQATWEMIDELGESGTTTLLTTQYLDEADRLADDIAVIDRGKMIARGTSSQLKRQVGGDLVDVTLVNAEEGGRVADLLAARACSDIHSDGPTVTVPVDDATGVVPEIVRELDHAGVVVQDVSVRRSTLDDVFFAITGHPAEDAETAEADEEGPAEKAPAEAGT